MLGATAQWDNWIKDLTTEQYGGSSPCANAMSGADPPSDWPPSLRHLDDGWMAAERDANRELAGDARSSRAGSAG